MTNAYVKGNICRMRGSYYFFLTIYIILLFLIVFRNKVKFKLNDKIEKAFLVMTPLLIILMTEGIYNSSSTNIATKSLLIGYILLLVVCMLIYPFFKRYKNFYVLVYTIAWVHGIVNYFMINFKGMPITLGDLLAYKTGLEVMGQYEYILNDQVIIYTLIYLGICTMVQYLGDKPEKSTKSIYTYSGCGIGILIYLIALSNIKIADLCKIELNLWTPTQSTYQNGAFLEFILETQNLKKEKPKGYSKAEAEKLLAQYETEQGQMEVKPLVIAIMNESFSDLSVLGEFQSSEYLENWKGFDDYMLRGNAYVSTYGGGTCNSEFEFLTFSSMANLPSGVYPYRMYKLNNTSSLVKEFGLNGYEGTAMHPANKSNWSRDKIYPQIGFQQFLDLDQFTDLENIKMYPSDQTEYQNMIKVIEQTDGPSFIFNVTIQNHGGYNYSDLGNVEPVEIESKYSKYKDVITYLSCMRESDKAFSELMAYLSNLDRPVVLCIFGDHQPGLDNQFVRDLSPTVNNIQEKQEPYIVPYLIYTNYMTNKKENKDLSLNYLGADLMEIVGVSSPYTNFLLEMQKEVPIVNINGYQTADGNWHNLNEENEWIHKYRILQYYMLFEKK